MGASWERLGASWERLEASCGQLGAWAISEPTWTIYHRSSTASYSVWPHPHLSPRLPSLPPLAKTPSKKHTRSQVPRCILEPPMYRCVLEPPEAPSGEALRGFQNASVHRGFQDASGGLASCVFFRWRFRQEGRLWRRFCVSPCTIWRFSENHDVTLYCCFKAR